MLAIGDEICNQEGKAARYRIKNCIKFTGTVMPPDSSEDIR